MSAQITHDRVYGCLFGLAIGDALGVPLQGMERDVLPRVINMMGGGVYSLKPGDWTAPTAQAMAMGYDLIKHRGFVGNSILERFVEWYEYGMYTPTNRCIGATQPIVETINEFNQLGGWRNKANNESIDPTSVVRVAPVAMAFATKKIDCATNARLQSFLTHGNHIPAEICVHFSLGMQHAFYSGSKDHTLAGFDSFSSKIGKWRDIDRKRVKSTDNVIDAFKAALWSVDSTNNFEEALIMAVNLAGESSIVGGITGQLAGSIYGYSSIPQRWLDQLAWFDELIEVSYRLYEMNL
jgi:ADP-ribosyl-[dinitrogen reductase] hydrolase